MAILVHVVLAIGTLCSSAVAARHGHKVTASSGSAREAATEELPPCVNGTLHMRNSFKAISLLPAYFVEFPTSPNTPRLQCQLAPTFAPINLEAAMKNTAEDFEKWRDQGLIAWDHILGGWDRNPVKYASIYLSHLNIWRQIARDEDGWTGVFEGDTLFRHDFHEILADLRRQLDSGALPETDIVYMGHCMNNDCATQGRVGSLTGGVKVIRSDMPVCSHAYLLSRHGAEILRDHALPMRQNNDDAPMRSLIREGKLRSLSLCPQIARQSDKEWMPTEWFPAWLYTYYIPLNYTVIVSLRVLANHWLPLAAAAALALIAVAMRRTARAKFIESLQT